MKTIKTIFLRNVFTVYGEFRIGQKADIPMADALEFESLKWAIIDPEALPSFITESGTVKRSKGPASTD